MIAFLNFNFLFFSFFSFHPYFINFFPFFFFSSTHVPLLFFFFLPLFSLPLPPRSKTFHTEPLFSFLLSPFSLATQSLPTTSFTYYWQYPVPTLQEDQYPHFKYPVPTLQLCLLKHSGQFGKKTKKKEEEDKEDRSGSVKRKLWLSSYKPKCILEKSLSIETCMVESLSSDFKCSATIEFVFWFWVWVMGFQLMV